MRAVKGGFLTEEEWEEFSSHYDKKKLKPETRERVNAWHEKKLEAYDYNEKIQRPGKDSQEHQRFNQVQRQEPNQTHL